LERQQKGSLKLATNYKSAVTDYKIWTFIARTDKQNSDYTIKWSSLLNVPPDNELLFYIHDLTNNMRKHAEKYTLFVEVNLESHPEYIRYFRELYGKPDQLLKVISNAKSIKYDEKRSTLLFIDEIQASKEALLSLRYFKEKLPQVRFLLESLREILLRGPF